MSEIPRAETSDAPSVDRPPRPGDRWRQSIKDAAVPESLRAGSPEPAFTLEPEMFRWRPDEDAEQEPRPSRRRALEALPERGSVLDVGVGGGASSLGLAPRAGLIVGVDRLEAMLESFLESALTAGVAARAVHGAWPDAAHGIEPVDVVVCHHAIYGVEEIEDFLTALTTSARHRVVLEVSSHAPPLGLGPMWEAIHGVARPDRVVADELEAVIAAVGVDATREDVVLPPRPREVTPERVTFARRRLLVGPERDEEIAELFRTLPALEHRVAALWWPGAAPAAPTTGDAARSRLPAAPVRVGEGGRDVRPTQGGTMAEGHEQHGEWEAHEHKALVHAHRHYHVTHNHNRIAGGFDHLSSEHEHEHDHALITHAHYPHENFEQEHQGEAHDHDHDMPVKKTEGAKAAAKNESAAKSEAPAKSEAQGKAGAPAKEIAAKKAPAKKAATKKSAEAADSTP